MAIDDDVLEHYGKKGMKWGVRKSDSSPTSATVTQKKPGGKLSTSGGKNQPASSDAKTAATSRQTAKSSGIHALDNNQLQTAVRRMQLEQQFSQLTAQRNTSPLAVGKRFVNELLGVGKTANEVIKFNESPAGKNLKKQLTDTKGDRRG